jgi:hypothetical protein
MVRTLGYQHWEIRTWAESIIKISIVGRVQDNSNTINVHVTSRLHCRRVQLALPEGMEQHNGIINK